MQTEESKAGVPATLSSKNAAARVLVVCRMSPRINGRARALVDALDRDYDVTVVSELPSRLPPARTLGRAALLEYPLAFGQRSFFHVAGAIRLIQMAILGLVQAVRLRPAVVVCADAPYCVTGLLAKWFLGSRFVFDAYEIIWGIGYGPVFAGAARWLERLVLWNCDLWLVPSEDRGRIVREAQNLSNPYTVIPNLPALGRVETGEMRRRLQAAGVPSGIPTILFQGTLVERRGIAELLEAARLGAFHVIVQGDGPLRDFVERNAGPSITLLPPCPNDEAISWLSAVTAAFVYYENDCINSAYACSSKFYAALIAGTAVVCNDLPVFSAFAKRHGGCILFDRLEPAAIAAAIRRAVEIGEPLRTQAAQAGAGLREFPRAETLRAVIGATLKRQII